LIESCGMSLKGKRILVKRGAIRSEITESSPPIPEMSNFNETRPLMPGADFSRTNLNPFTDEGQESLPNSNTPFLSTALRTALLILLVIAIIECCFIIAPGEIGIVVTLGHAAAFEPGLHFRAPFVSRLTRMSSKTQLLEQNNVIPTKEGLSVRLDTAILFRLDPFQAANLYTAVGKNYVSIIIDPESASAIRGFTSESEAKALYTSGRNTIQESVKEELQRKLAPRGIVIEDVLLKDIELPAELTKSIELKAQAEQDAARMQFVLQKESQEADRKRIEAQGIADFQRIVSANITENLLKWKGIEATQKFAGSTNTKIVIMGNSGDSLPVILGGP